MRARGEAEAWGGASGIGRGLLGLGEAQAACWSTGLD